MQKAPAKWAGSQSFACVKLVNRLNQLCGASCLACWVVLVLFPADLAHSQNLRDLIGSVGTPRSAISTPPLPSVARIIVPERGGTSYGSGSLVYVERDYAVVVTNWHVVSDRVGDVSVQFPDGFQSAGKVLKVDKDWDLAAIGIWRPHVEPMRFAQRAPEIGEPLAIGGYGAGQWRLAPGRCTQFVSPGSNFPAEMVEVSVEARQGDSGGPILNQQGEIAGVLFGAGRGSTSGSHCVRVQSFLESVYPILREAPDVGISNIASSTSGNSANKSPVVASANWEQPNTPQDGASAERAGGLLIEEPRVAQASSESRAARPLVAAKQTPRRATDNELRDWVKPAASEEPESMQSPAGSLASDEKRARELDQSPMRVARISRQQFDGDPREDRVVSQSKSSKTLVAPREQEDCSKFDPAFPSLSGGTEAEVYSLSETEAHSDLMSNEAKELEPREGLLEQGKAFLALLGGVTILFQLMKFFGGKSS